MNLNSRTSALSCALLLSSTLLVLPTGSAEAQQSRRPVMSAAQCQPLTEANFEMCCVARNRSQFLTPDEIRSCPPVTTALVARVVEAMGGEGDDLRRDGRSNAARAAGAAAVDNTATGSVGASAGNTPGNSGNAPGKAGSPGNSANAPGKSGNAPGQGGGTAGAPGNSGNTPAKDKSASKGNDGFGNGGNDGKASGKHDDVNR